MWKAIVYKEWLKTRWLLLGLSVLGLGVLVYMFISLGRVYRIMGIAEVWDVIVNRHQILFTELQYYPVLCGTLIALAQFIPEMLKKRLKLTLHLPIAQKTAYFGMQLYGLGILLVGFAVQLILLYIYSLYYFPKEIIGSAFLTLLPWYSAGFTVYIFTAFICVEPVWLRRVFYLLIACGVLYFSYLSAFPGAYEKVWWLFILLPIYVFAFPWLSVIRFKKGVQ